MKVCNHAVRRYKQRVGGRTSSRERIVKQIKNEISNNTVKSYLSNNNHLYIETRKFIAVVYKGTIITILPTEPEQHERIV